MPQAGGTITHNIYFRNDGFRTITFEDIIDALGEGPLDPNTNLPARGTYVPGSTRLDDVPTTLEPVYSATLHELRWSSSFSLAPAGELVISFDIEYPPIAGNYPHAARAEIAGGSEGSGLGTACGGAGDVTQIDTTYDLSDDIPSTATISVASPNTAPTQADATVVLAVGDVLATYGVEPDHSDPESDPIGTVTIDAATGGVASWDETTGLISFVPDDPDAAGTWTVSYEVCDTGDPVLCDTATLTLLWNDPPVLEDLSLGSGLDPVLSWGAETTFALGDYVLGTGLVMADDPDDGDTDGLATISVGATASGPFGATADVGSGASCAAATDGTVTLTAGTTSGVTECFVQVCEELPFNDVRVCAVTSMGFTVVECQSTNECSTGLVCDLTDNRCVECIDDTECSGVNDRCDATTRTCVACLDATDCNDSNECTLDQCTDNVCANPSVDAGTECTTGVCDGAPTDPSCIDCYVTADPDDVDPGCLTATPECLEDPLSGDLTCVECKRDEDCQGEEVCNLVFHSCVDPDALSAEDDGYLIQVGASLVVSTAAEGLLANDSVPPSAEVTLEVVAASAPDPVTEGTLAVNQDGTFSFVPVEGFVGTVVFTYELTTPLAGFATADVTLKVNGGPVAEDDTAEVDEDGSVVIAVLDNDSDPNGDALEVTAVTGGPSHGTVQVNADGTISYTPSTNYNGPDTFTCRVCDIHDVCDTAAVSITVNPVNDAPVGRDDYGLTPEDTPILIAVLVNDSDVEGDLLSVGGIPRAPRFGDVEVLADGSVLYTPDLDFHGRDTFEYSVCDPSGDCDVALVTVDVEPVNDAPVAEDDAVSILDGETVVVEVLANDSDADGDDLGLPTIVIAPRSGTVDVGLDGALTYTPADGFVGTDVLIYEICDPDGACDRAQVIFDVGSGDATPEAFDDTATVVAGGSVVVDVLANDVDDDGDALEVRDVSTALHGTVAIDAGGLPVYTPRAGFTGTDTFSYTACDASGACDAASVTVTVTAGENTPPVAADDLGETLVGTPVTIAVLSNDEDIDGDTLTVLAVSTTTSGTTAVEPDGGVTFTPAPGFVGTVVLTVTIGDGRGGEAGSTLTIFVNEVPNSPPTAVDDTFEVAVSGAQALDVLANDSDADGDTLIVVDVVQPVTGFVSIAQDGTLTFTPNASAGGTDTFTYTVSDGRGGFETATVTLVFPPPGPLPTARDDFAETPEDTAVLVVVLSNDSDPAGAALTVTGISTAPRFGSAAILPDSTVLYTPLPDFHGLDTFVYTACNAAGDCASAVATIEVLSVNDSPVGGEDSVSTLPEIEITIPVLDNDADPDGDTLTVTGIVSEPSEGTAVVNADGTITYTPNAWPGYIIVDVFLYEVCDAAGACDIVPVTVTIGSPNQAPVAVDDAATTTAGEAVVIDALANDSDPDADDVIALTVFGGAEHGWVRVVEGRLEYTPRVDFVGEDRFFYTICDVEGLCASADVVVTVTEGPNTAPIATDDVANTLTGQAVIIDALSNDFDGDGDALFIVDIAAPENGTATVGADGAITYTPAPGFVGVERFEVTIADGRGGFDTSVVTVFVTEIDNRPPTAVDDDFTVSRRNPTPLDVLANDSDADDDTIFIIDIVQPTCGTVAIGADGIPVYIPLVSAAGAVGDSFTYTVSDGRGGIATATVTLIFPVGNGVPVALDDAAETPEDIAVIVVVLANDSDPEGDDIRLDGIASAPLHGTATAAADGTITYTPDADYHGPDAFSYTVCDTNDGCAMATVSITVTPVNDAPVAEDDATATAEATSVVIEVLVNDSDADGDDLDVFRISFAPRFGTAAIGNDGAITYTPNDGFSGRDSFTYEVCDPFGACDRAVVTVDVTDTNAAPVAADDSAEVNAGGSVEIAVLDNDSDPDDDALALESFTQGVRGAVTEGPDGTLVYTPEPGFTGADSFAYTVCDPSGVCDSATVSVTVLEGLNLQPTAADDVASVVAGNTVIIDVLANDSDPDGDVLTVTEIGTVSTGVARVNPNGDVTYTAPAGFTGLVSFEITVGDGRGGFDTSTVYVHVTAAANQAPVAEDDRYDVAVGDEFTLDVLSNDSDPDGDTVVIIDVVEPVLGTIAFNTGGQLVYVPFPGASGVDSFTYTVSDGKGGVDTATVTLVYPTGNNPPSASDDFATTPEDQGVLLNVLANDGDPDGDAIAMEGIASEPVHGTAVVLEDDTVFYTPPADWSGEDSFTYTICDARGDCSTALVRITVTPVNDAPVAGDDVATTAAGQAVAIAVLNNDYDVDGDILSVGRIVIAPRHGVVSVSAAGVVTYTPTAGFSGSDFFTYTACDTSGACDTALVTVVVGAGNAAPVAADDAASTAFETAISIAVLDNDSDADGDLLTITVVENPVHGTAALAEDGTILFTPGSGFSGVATFFYTACDPSGVCDNAIVTVTVGAPGNRAPSAVDDLLSTPTGVARTISPLVNDTDPDGDALFIAEVTDPSHGSVTVHGDGTVTYTPAPGYVGEDSFDLIVSDEDGATSVSTVWIIVTPAPNNAPEANDDSYDVVAGETVSLAVLANDFDADGDALVIVEVVQPLSGTVTFNADGTLSYTANAGGAGSDTFTYIVSDGRGGFATATVTLVFPVENLPPVALDDRVTTPEDVGVLVAVAANDFDPEGEIIDVTRIVDQPVNGVAVLRPDDTILYRPFANFHGTDRLTYEVCDPQGACTVASVVIIVQPVNDQPVAADDSVATPAGEPVVVDVLANDFDVDEDALTVSRIRFAPASGTAVIGEDGSITYTPAAGFSGTVTFTYEVCDPAGLCDEATVTVEVGGDNGAPVLVDDTATVSAGETVLIDVLANDSDPDGDTLTVTLVSPPRQGRVTITDEGLVSYRASAAYNGEDTFTYTACDEDGLCETATVVVTVTREGNNPPVGVDDTFSTSQDTATTFDVTANDFDPDGDALRVIDIGNPLHGTVEIGADGQLTYTPDAGFVGEDVFAVTITDGRGGSDTETIRVVVTADANVPPVAGDDTYDVTGAVMNLDVLVNDSDANGDTIVIVDVVQPEHGTVVIAADGTLTFIPEAGYVGDDSFTYTVSDGRGGTAIATVTLVGMVTNRAPEAADDVATTFEDRPVLIVVLANDVDPDGDVATVTGFPVDPRHGTVEILADSTVLYTPNPDWHGVDTFVYTACDPLGLCGQATVVVTVLPVNDAPMAGDDTVPTPADTPVVIPVLLNDGDIDGDALAVTGIVGTPEGGTAVINEDGTITWTPDAGASGPATFTYEVCDSAGACDTAVVTVDVGEANQAPQAGADEAETDEGAPVTVFVLDNDSDPDGDTLSIAAVGDAPNGSVSIVEGAVVYTPDADFAGEDSFWYTICDDAGACASTLVTVTVLAGVNQPPVAIDDVVATPTGTPTLIVVTANDTDPDGDVLAAISATTPEHGRVTVNPDGTVTYTPEEGFTGTDTFTVTISDGEGGVAESLVTVIVLPGGNVAPEALDDDYDVPEGLSSPLSVMDNDTDADGDALEVVVIVQPSHGTARIGEDGTIVYTPDAGYVGPDSFTYTVSDGKGGFDTATVTIHVGDRDRDGLPDLVEEAGCSDPDDADSDGDGLDDGFEVSGGDPYAYDVGGDTNPCSADTDNDGLDDGTETRGDGVLAEIGPLDPRTADTDGDGIQDGTEIGLTEPVPGGESEGGKPFAGTDTSVFVPDADPTTTTDPTDDDTDDDGLMDGTEDANGNGRWDGEIGGTGTAGSGETDPNMVDTDGDCIQDGTELGLTEPEGDGTDLEVFVPDTDPATTTDPLDTDTDDGGLGDVAEDLSCNGRVDDGETDPNDPSDEVPENPFYSVTGGQSCGGGGVPGSAPWLLVLLGLAALARRRRSGG